MKGINHELSATLAGGISAIYLMTLHYPLSIPTRLFFGFAILSLWFSCDNDSPKSRPLQRWGPLKFIWLPFVEAGHREILHNPVWGAAILCFIPAIPIAANAYYTHNFENVWILIGLIGSTELHIFTDKLSSIRTSIKKAFHLPF